MPPVKQNVMISPLSLQTKCNLKPWHQLFSKYRRLFSNREKTKPHLPEFLLYQFLHPSFFGVWYRVHLSEVALFGL